MNSTTPAQAYAVPDVRDKPAGSVPDRSIGAILIKVGRLAVADAEKVSATRSSTTCASATPPCIWAC